MSSDSQTLLVDVTRSSDQVEVEITRRKKKKHKKRKRDDSGSSFTSSEPPRRHPLLPSSHQRQIPTPFRPISQTLQSERGDTRSPLTPLTPINTSLSLLAPFQPIYSWPKATFFGSKLFSSKPKTAAPNRFNEACDLSSPLTSDTEPANVPNQLSRPHTPYLNTLHRHSADKDRIIQDLQRKVVAKDSELAEAQERMAELEREGQDADAGYDWLREDRDAERFARKQAEEKLKLLQAGLRQVEKQKGDLSEAVSRLEGESRAQTILLAQADEKVANASRQVRTAVGRGRRWMARAGGLEAHLKEAKAMGEVEKQKTQEAKDKLASISTNPPIEESSQLRHSLLLAKTDLAKERLVTQNLRSQLETTTARVAARDTTIIALQAQLDLIKQERDDLMSRNASLDEECEKQLAELESQLNTVNKLSTENNDLQAIRATLDDRVSVLDVQLTGSSEALKASVDRAEWYKAEYKRRDTEAKHFEDQIQQERRILCEWKLRAMKSGRSAADIIEAHRALVEASQLITKLDGNIKRASGREADLRGELKRKMIWIQGMTANERYRKEQWDSLNRKCQVAEGEAQEQRNRVSELESDLTKTSAALWTARLGGKASDGNAEGEGSSTACEGEGNTQVKEENEEVNVNMPNLQSRLGSLLVEVGV